MNSNCFVGLEFKQDLRNKELFINQFNYITRILKRFNMEDCNPVNTPADPSIFLSAKDYPKNDSERQEMKNMPYREVVGSLMFVAIVSRPDIMYAVSQISCFLSNPRKVIRLPSNAFFDLQGSTDVGILYTNNNCMSKIFSDADFANDEDNRKSISGYISIYY